MRGFDGSGQKIAVIGASAINLSDIQRFRDTVELPANDPQLILAPGAPDPGKTGFYHQAVSDVEIAGASAPKASIIYVYSGSPFRAAQYAIDQNLAPVITYTYDTCEMIWSRSDRDAARALAQQANSQGITWIASSGNSGAAGCEIQFRDPAGQSGPWVTIPAALPEVTAVGGTTFVEGGGDYWAGDQARSYIPEIAWNSTSLGQGLNASGGGASVFFQKPEWQEAPGVPKMHTRLVPDIAFAASWDHDPYLIIVNGEPWAWGGTSSAAPFFAGVLSILNQYLVSTGVQTAPGLGNINPRLYELARATPDVFHDVTAGDNIVPCKPGSSDCLLDRYGYSAAPGWDAVTGLGSLDVEKFVVNWPAASPSGITSTFLNVSASPATVDANASTTLTATVKATSGGAVPMGVVTFRTAQRVLGDATLTDSGASARLTVDAGQLSAGLNTITAQYAGGSMFWPSTGTADVTVTGAASVIVVSADPPVVYKQAPDADGYAWHYRIQLADTGGTPTAITQLSIDQTDYSDRISSMFGGFRIPAYGSLRATLRAKITSTPVDHTYTFGGIDAGGTSWKRQITLRFLAEQGSATMSLSSSPSTLRLSPQGDPHCAPDHPLYHQLNLQESNGIAVQLNKFVADGKDVSAQIDHWFGSTRLPAFGLLQASLCWNGVAFPVSRDFEVAGIDATGAPVSATLKVTLTDGVPNPGTLAISKKAVELSAATGSTESTLSVNLPATETWTVSVLPANQKTRWLAVSPTSGRGPTQLKLTANSSGLATGAYTATLVFQSDKTTPQAVNVPVVFLVGN